ncbi:MAG: ATP synthase F1 subunit gamma [Vampirovibrionales bacterium]|nr:ATP synthase F1 subunit gamma [Vampirovibrionales bacterium]
MPNLKDIRRRIKSVRNTQKITQAMRMVAAAKVKRAEARLKAARPFGEYLESVFASVYQEASRNRRSLEGTRYLELFNPRPPQKVGVVVISSDRGLCGAFNATIIRQAFKLERSIRERGLSPSFYLVGRKAATAFQRYSDAPALGRMVDMTATPSSHDADVIAETLTQAFLSGEIDSIAILSTHFKSMISYRAMMTPVLPLQGSITQLSSDIALDAIGDRVNPMFSPGKAHPQLELEPTPALALERLTPLYLSNILYIRLLESAASELAARMTAMASATSNAADIIQKLTLQYNKARQAAITQEILEVVSGAQALA